ncbi:endolytic transglycosylase MltG [Paradevosia shaoguanensis]|uniref:Endolytic murein transglycosylase n=1 Tax=Paradevosia shaoguanensis TaxID=1335043 RepID=A0AA41QN80_9HYPH|nr:endolytic transglycosylase MltG [Paradevosia shaoguanensis]MCF1742123.1 endolytic transglycosylase MltG [Paradevosia shaoguanensis]MCI0126606.1 endolytic transglycosylase MltG [Paradevosia shaoguanensis]
MADRKNKRAKPRRRNGLIDILNGVLSLFVIAMLLVGGLFFFGLNRFYSAGDIPQDTTFLVEPGSSLGLTAERLETQGLIDNRMIFQAAGMALKKQGKLKAGEFKIAAHSSMADILTELTEGVPVLYGVTVPEGFTSWQVIERINGDSHLIGEISNMPPEGSILPNTYSYIPGDTRQSVLDKMQAAQKKALDEIWAGRDPDLPIKTPEELVTLASVVEKETGVATERPQVAAVFVNRLKRGMRLQSDPTIIYGITKGQSTLGRGLKKSEIEAKTPYNTYQIDGLPAGPIANPGIESLRAAANPAKTKDLYFVAAGATPSDGHLFAENYADHRKNVAKWRAIEKQMAIDAQADTEAAKDAIEAEQAQETGDTTTTAQ